MPRKYPNDQVYARVDMVPHGMRNSDEIRFIAKATESFFREASDKLADEIVNAATEKAKRLLDISAKDEAAARDYYYKSGKLVSPQEYHERKMQSDWAARQQAKQGYPNAGLRGARSDHIVVDEQAIYNAPTGTSQRAARMKASPKKNLSTVNQLWSEVNEWLKDIKLAR